MNGYKVDEVTNHTKLKWRNSLKQLALELVDEQLKRRLQVQQVRQTVNKMYTKNVENK